jgi:sec-independent protein translocase protein TatB
VRKARGVAREFQTHIDDMMRESELDELRQQALKARDMNLQKMMEETVDPKGELKNAFNIDQQGGHPGSPPEDGAADDGQAKLAVQPQPATEPPVTAVPAAAPVAESVSAPASPAPTSAPTRIEPSQTDKQA